MIATVFIAHNERLWMCFLSTQSVNILPQTCQDNLNKIQQFKSIWVLKPNRSRQHDVLNFYELNYNNNFTNAEVLYLCL